jgi:hypothetical protein
MSSKDQKKMYNDKNIRNRKERNDKRTMKNSMYCEDPFLTEGDYDKNINSKKKELINDNQSDKKNDLEVEHENNKEVSGANNDACNENCSEEEFNDSYFEPIVYK